MTKRRICWAVLSRSINRLDGDRSYFQGVTDHPTRTLLFETRAEARRCVKERWGYIVRRPDLRCEPHGWRMPRVVRVAVSIEMWA
jgi:hypothetical protein